MSENAQILLVIWSFWLAVIGLDLVVLLMIRRTLMDPTAKALWTVWVIVVPIVGALSYLIVKPSTAR
jgi:hypothetical protein